MQYELLTLDADRALLLRVIETPSLERAQVLNTAMLADLSRLGFARLLVDCRELERSDFQASDVRGLLHHLDRSIARHAAAGQTPDRLRIALLSDADTFGHGIARMTVGHAYGLPHLQVHHATDRDAALNWLRQA
ncbi:hypothetical protein [Pseudooceanicola sp.]|uniref:hypothetical protein n=1 Tax=Pseudooceanicola sp. TaxID=1914328 RepID=UPI0035C77D54